MTLFPVSCIFPPNSIPIISARRLPSRAVPAVVPYNVLSDRIKEAVNGKLPLPYLDVIGYIEPEDISLKLALEVEHYGPYGNSWLEPCFITKAKFLSSYNYGTAKLCKFSRYGRTTFQGIYSFDRTNGITLDNWQDTVIQDKYYYLVFTIQLGYVNGSYTLDIAIKDIIPIE